MKYDLIIFDCDGTLLDSEYANNQCCLDLMPEFGLPEYTLEYALENWLGKALDDIVVFEAEKNNVKVSAKDFIARFIAAVPDYQKRYIKKIEGAFEAVTALHEKYKCCVASNGELPSIISSLELTGFGGLFAPEHFFSKDMVPRAKPYPDLFLHACGKMSIAADKSIVVEDSVSGVKAGRAAGMYVIGFNGVGHGDAPETGGLIDHGADIVFSRWKDILDHINSL